MAQRNHPAPQYEGDFEQLCAVAAACVRCPAMAGRRRLLSHANGAPNANVIFIGEAPGRRGGERTSIPFSGDQSGRNFEQLLTAAGVTRQEIFVTNAVLCNPRDGVGRNRPPTRQEIENCSALLAWQLQVVAAPVVVTLGSIALQALHRLTPHQLQLRAAVGQPTRWSGRWLVPLYHPGPRAQLHRSFAQQVADFTALGALVRAVLSGNFSADLGVSIDR